MPNYCDYEMKIKGTKKNCQEWLSRMNDYEKENHFWRIFDADIVDEDGTENNYEMTICGDCAWSLESCCRASGYSNGVDLFEVNTRELNLIMEAWSTEPGMAFQEHYIYNNGECQSDECIEYNEYWYDEDEYESIEKFAKEFDLGNITEDDLDENDYYHTGGFENYGQYEI